MWNCIPHSSYLKIDIGCVLNMIWISFGNDNNCNDKWALHIQSSFRILDIENMKIVVASSDLYWPSSKISDEKDFDWEIQGNNLFDEKIKKWLQNNAELFVDKCDINLWGDLRIVFSNGERLDIFVDSSEYVECWRLFEKNNKERNHLVITGLGYDEL